MTQRWSQFLLESILFSKGWIWVEKDNINPKQRNFYNFKRLNLEKKIKAASASMLEVAAFVVLIYLLLFKNNSCYLPPISKKQLVQLLLIFIFFNSYFYWTHVRSLPCLVTMPLSPCWFWIWFKLLISLYCYMDL